MIKKIAFNSYGKLMFVRGLFLLFEAAFLIGLARSLSQIALYAIEGASEDLVAYALEYGGILLLFRLLLSIGQGLVDLSCEKKKLQMKAHVFSNLLEQRLLSLEDLGRGRVLHLLKDDVQVFSNLYLIAGPTLISSSLGLLAYFIWLARISLPLTLLIFFIACLPVISPLLLRHRFKRDYIAVQEAEDASSAYVLQTIHGNETIKSLNLYDAMNVGFEDRLKEIFIHGNKTEKTLRTQDSINEGIDKIATFLIYGLLGYSTLRAYIVPDKVVEILLLSQQVTVTMKKIFKQAHARAQGRGAEKRLTVLFKQDHHLSDGLPVKSFEVLDLKDLSFAYHEGDDVFTQVNLTIRQGDRVLIRGENGSGKTTLLKILMKLYDSYQGQVLINGRDLKTIDSKSYSQLITWQVQEPVFFYETVEENLRENKTHTQAELADWFKKLSLSLDLLKQPIDQLSGGQQKKISLMMALMRETPILILDEPFNYLDQEGKDLVLDLLKKTNRTLLIISHGNEFHDLTNLFLDISERGILTTEAGSFCSDLSN